MIAARMGSSRLPGKSLMHILGKPMLERMVERLRYSQCVDHIVVATTDHSEDDSVEQLTESIGVACFRGSSNDVLDRINAAVVAFDADLIINLLGDNPLVHGYLIDDVVEFHQEGEFEYVTNVTTEHPHAGSAMARFPIGVRVEVFSAAMLDLCAQLAEKPHHREHSTSYFHEHPEVFKLGYFEAKDKWRDLHRPELSLAINYQENLIMVRRVFERCYEVDPNFSLSDVMTNLDSDPSLVSLMGVPS